MANTIKLKRSAVASAVPTTAQLQLGELAINTYDGKLYMKKDNGTASIVEIGAGGGSYLPLTGGTLTGDLSFSGNGRRITGDFTSNATITNRVMVQSSTTNGNTLFSLIPNGTATQTRYLAYNASDPTNASVGGMSVLSTDVRLASTANGTGTLLPLAFFMSTTQAMTVTTLSNVLIGTTTDDTTNKLQVTGNTALTGSLFVSTLTANKAVFTDASKVLTSTGTLGVDQGGTGVATLTGIVKGNGTSAFTAAVAGTDYQAPLVSGTNIKTINGSSVLGSGDLVVSGSMVYPGAGIAVSTGTAWGTSISVPNGVVKGNGTTLSAATAGTDYVAPGTATTFTQTQNFAASGITLKGSSTGITTFASANSSATNYTVTFPASTGTVLTTAAAVTVAQGGTGATTLTGVLKGNGTSAFTAAVAGTDYASPSQTFFIGTTQVAINRASAALTLNGITLTDPTIVGTVAEDVFTITDGASVDIDPSNGSIQLWTLGANRTPTATNFLAGEAVTLMIDDGTARTITWSTINVTWKTNGGVAPTLNTTGYTVIVLWKVGTTVYGARAGNA